MRRYAARLPLFVLLTLSLTSISLCLRGYAEASQAAAERDSGQLRYEELGAEGFSLLEQILKSGKYAPFAESFSPAFPIPGLAEGYVPQGMCYSEALSCFIVASYYQDNTRPSMISLIDKNGKHVKSLYLLKPGGVPYFGHAGGAAAWRGHVWITSENRAWRLAAEDLAAAKDRETVRFRDFFRPGVRGSMAFCDGDTLWIGEFYTDTHPDGFPPSRRDPATGNMAWCAAFALDEALPMAVKNLKHSGDKAVPQKALSLPDYIQGGCVAGTGQLILSQSWSSKQPSRLLVFENLHAILAQTPAYEVKINGKACPLWVIDKEKANADHLMAPMSEGACAVGGRIFVLFESAALLYRERAALFADYVFYLPEALL